MFERVDAVGFTVHESDVRGWLMVTAWVRKAGRPGSEVAEYDHLTFTEACDVMLAILDSNRPGDEVGEGWIQPQFWRE